MGLENFEFDENFNTLYCNSSKILMDYINNLEVFCAEHGIKTKLYDVGFIIYNQSKPFELFRFCSDYNIRNFLILNKEIEYTDTESVKEFIINFSKQKIISEDDNDMVIRFEI